MKLKELISGLKCIKINYNEEIDIKKLCINDKDCVKDSLFFCINGNNFNGSKFVKNAIENGAVALVLTVPVEEDIPQIIVKDVRATVNKLCELFYDSPQKKLRTVAIVGTNGKTSVCEIIYKILNDYGIACGKIGTLGAEFKEKLINTGFTTPDTPNLYSLLSSFVKQGCKVVCMELSAHAIYYNKANFKFDLIVYTNCSHDHLDFFKTEEKYQSVKASVFTEKKCKLAIVNSDDPLGKRIACNREKNLITYGINEPSDVFAIDVTENAFGIEYIINLFDKLYEIKSSLMGTFNVYNALASATVCALCGVKTDFIAKRLCEINQIRGRMERISNKVNLFIDYAHTPDSLKNALQTLKKIKGENKLICVFGCGGNRDNQKRAVMGRISGELADFTIITSDNPRFEDENKIIRQIEEGVREKTLEYIAIRSREQAIEYAVQIAKVGDYLLIAGKGAEEYQEQMGVFKQFSDKEVALTHINNKYDKL